MDHGGKRKGAGRKKGGQNQKTKLWNEFGEWLLSEGMQGYWQELEELRESRPKRLP